MLNRNISHFPFEVLIIKKQLSSHVSAKGNHVLSHALVEYARGPFCDVCVGGEGVCKVLKVLNRRRLVMQSSYNTIQRSFKKKEKLEVDKSDTFQTMKIGLGIIMSSSF